MLRGLAVLIGALLCVAAAGAAYGRRAQGTIRREALPLRSEPVAPVATAAPVLPPFVSAPKWPALRLTNVNSNEVREVALYDAAGRVDEARARELDALLCDARDPKHHESAPLDRRTLQLVYRAAYHFRATEVEVISAYRKPSRRREGLHARGQAIDFKLPGVTAAALASYLRTLSRVGVGVYTHPRTQYVHLDVREQSYHWLDASPPGRTWRERSIGNPRLIAQADASYHAERDFPE